MKKEFLSLLCCPECQSNLVLTEKEHINGKIKSGDLYCEVCNCSYPIRNFVPRFVEYNHYANSFGPQWKTFATSQLDDGKFQESALRFRTEIGWGEEELKDKTVIEFGSGAGRFVDVVSKLSPRLVIGLDVTDAVDASQENMGDRDNVLFIQGDIFKLPVKSESMDFAYSIGVLHHTPEPEKGFKQMIRLTRVGGTIGVSLYEISLYRRPNRNSVKISTVELLWALNLWRCELFRMVTTRIPTRFMLTYCKTVIPVLHYINKVPVLRVVRYLLPSTCYSHLPVVCSMVDTYDTYATKIVHMYRGKDVFQWFVREGLSDIMLNNSRAGWVSVTGAKGTEQERNKKRKVQAQPLGPGLIGTFNPS